MSKANSREHNRGMSDSAPLYALLIVSGAVGVLALLILTLCFML